MSPSSCCPAKILNSVAACSLSSAIGSHGYVRDQSPAKTAAMPLRLGHADTGTGIVPPLVVARQRLAKAAGAMEARCSAWEE